MKANTIFFTIGEVCKRNFWEYILELRSSRYLIQNINVPKEIENQEPITLITYSGGFQK